MYLQHHRLTKHATDAPVLTFHCIGITLHSGSAESHLFWTYPVFFGRRALFLCDKRAPKQWFHKSHYSCPQTVGKQSLLPLNIAEDVLNTCAHRLVVCFRGLDAFAAAGWDARLKTGIIIPEHGHKLARYVDHMTEQFWQVVKWFFLITIFDQIYDRFNHIKTDLQMMYLRDRHSPYMRGGIVAVGSLKCHHVHACWQNTEATKRFQLILIGPSSILPSICWFWRYSWRRGRLNQLRFPPRSFIQVRWTYLAPVFWTHLAGMIDFAW